jgi:hypothetical protein
VLLVHVAEPSFLFCRRLRLPDAIALHQLEADGHRIFFKIDYYDTALACHSPDPADPAVTQRVITIMLAEEY